MKLLFESITYDRKAEQKSSTAIIKKLEELVDAKTPELIIKKKILGRFDVTPRGIFPPGVAKKSYKIAYQTEKGWKSFGSELFINIDHYLERVFQNDPDYAQTITEDGGSWVIKLKLKSVQNNQWPEPYLNV